MNQFLVQRGQSIGACSRELVEHVSCVLENNQTQSLAVREPSLVVPLGAFVAHLQSLHLVVDERHLATGADEPLVDLGEPSLEVSVVTHRH